MTDMRLGPWLRQHRARKGFTQDQLAELIGTSQPLISRWERGLSAPVGDLLNALVEALDLSIGEIIARMGGFSTEVEEAIVTDTLLDRKLQNALLAAYGEMTGRQSLRIAEVLRTRRAS